MGNKSMHRVVVVGVGSIGERHLRCFLKTERAELGLVEINPELRAAVAGRYGIQEAFSDLDAAIARGFDAAVVATPAHLHVPMATRLAEAGLDLLIEKPLSIGLDGVENLQTTVRQR